MQKITKDEFVRLQNLATEIYTGSCANYGCSTGRLVDFMGDLPDGRRLEATCDCGWYYQYWLFTQEEKEKTLKRVPQNIAREIGCA